MLTFQFLRELQKKERQNAELQPIDQNFYKLVAEYVGRKSRLAEQKSSFQSVEDSSDNLEKIIPIIRDIFNRRETKIINGALMVARSGAEFKNMLIEEKILFHHTRTGVSENRKRLDDILNGVILNVKLEGQDNGELPTPQQNELSEIKQALELTSNGLDSSHPSTNPDQAPTKESQEYSSNSIDNPLSTIPTAQKVKIKVLIEIPAFVGEDLDTYGPWKSGEEVECPSMVADIFLRTGKAEKAGF